MLYSGIKIILCSILRWEGIFCDDQRARVPAGICTLWLGILLQHGVSQEVESQIQQYIWQILVQGFPNYFALIGAC